MDVPPPSVFNAKAFQAREIAHLFYVDLAIAAVIFLTVAGLVVYAAFRYRSRPGAGVPYQDPGNPKLEITWTVIPALILLVLLVLTARAMFIVNPPVRSKTPDVTVIAHQWWWEYHYPESGVVTANELHMPAGKDWLLEIKSADVIHSFWVPDLGSKKDAIPGHPNHLFIRPMAAGIYLGACAEFCGADHGLMRIRVVVQPEEGFESWVKSQLQPPPEPTAPAAIRGSRLFDEKTCSNCHRIAGTKADGRVGPDLSHVGGRATLASAVRENNLHNLARWVKDPQKIKPGCHMPDMHLTDAEAHDIAAYLEGLE